VLEDNLRAEVNWVTLFLAYKCFKLFPLSFSSRL
jgi:hypothetical protein